MNDLEHIEKFEDWESKLSENDSVVTPGGTLIDSREGNHDDISVITESATVNLINLQAEYFESDEREDLKKDTLKTTQTHLKKIFRQAKFLSDTGNNFNKPNFVTQSGIKSQSVEICEYLWKSLGKILNTYAIILLYLFKHTHCLTLFLKQEKNLKYPL